LKRDVLNARREYAHYFIPDKIEKIGKKRYNLHKVCPFCNKEENLAIFAHYHGDKCKMKNSTQCDLLFEIT
jgi:hypothetical protein